MRFETLVFLHLRRHYREVFYVKGSDYDVDFAVTEGREITRLIQACYDPSAPGTLERELMALTRAAQKYPRAQLQLVTLYDDRMIEREGHRVEVVPGWKFCLRH
jgi:predicted AAA+ superfamily ATPase